MEPSVDPVNVDERPDESLCLRCSFNASESLVCMRGVCEGTLASSPGVEDRELVKDASVVRAVETRCSGEGAPVCANNRDCQTGFAESLGVVDFSGCVPSCFIVVSSLVLLFRLVVKASRLGRGSHQSDLSLASMSMVQSEEVREVPIKIADWRHGDGGLARLRTLLPLNGVDLEGQRPGDGWTAGSAVWEVRVEFDKRTVLEGRASGRRGCATMVAFIERKKLV